MKGIHLILDLYGCKEIALQDPFFLGSMIQEIISTAKMVLIEMHSILYEEHESSFGWGWSFNAILADSHVTIHTAPSKNRSAFIDVYSCSFYNADNIVEIVVDGFKPERFQKTVIERNVGIGTELW